MKNLALRLFDIITLAVIDHNAKFATAWTFTQALDPSFNPVRDHVADVKIDGCSRFYTAHNVDDVLELAKGARLLEVRKGRKGRHGRALCFVFEADVVIGEAVESMPIEGEKYVMQKVHGMLQPVGTVAYWPSGTKVFTIVLTPENEAGELALASAYPGYPDPEPRPGWENLIEGQELSAFQVLMYGLRPSARKN